MATVLDTKMVITKKDFESQTGEKWGDAVQVHESLRKFIEAIE